MFDFERCSSVEPVTGKEKLTREASSSAPWLTNLKSHRQGGRRMLKKTSSMILQRVVLGQQFPVGQKRQDLTVCSLYPFVDRAPISAIFNTRTLGEYFTIENQPNALTKCSTCYKNAGKGLDDGSSHLMVSNQDIPYMWYTVIFDQLKILPSAFYFEAWTIRQVRGKEERW